MQNSFLVYLDRGLEWVYCLGMCMLPPHHGYDGAAAENGKVILSFHSSLASKQFLRQRNLPLEDSGPKFNKLCSG